MFVCQRVHFCSKKSWKGDHEAGFLGLKFSLAAVSMHATLVSLTAPCVDLKEIYMC